MKARQQNQQKFHQIWGVCRDSSVSSVIWTKTVRQLIRCPVPNDYKSSDANPRMCHWGTKGSLEKGNDEKTREVSGGSGPKLPSSYAVDIFTPGSIGTSNTKGDKAVKRWYRENL